MDTVQELIYYGKLLHEKDLIIAEGGNISIREGQGLTIKRKGADMSEGSKEDYISVNFAKIDENMNKISTETYMHVGCYNVRDDIGAVIHVHSPYMVAAAEKGKILSSPSYEFDCIIKRDVPILEFIQPGSMDLAESVASEVKKGKNAILLKHHGGLAVGIDLREAYSRVLALERACITFLHI